MGGESIFKVIKSLLLLMFVENVFFFFSEDSESCGNLGEHFSHTFPRNFIQQSQFIACFQVSLASFLLSEVFKDVDTNFFTYICCQALVDNGKLNEFFLFTFYFQYYDKTTFSYLKKCANKNEKCATHLLILSQFYSILSEFL